MKRLLPLVILALMALHLNAQVGINNISPNASLDISASNQATPANNDGILVPRIDAFPAIDPGASQNSMIVYLTTTDGGNLPGFYFWNQTTLSWDSLNSAGADEINDLTDGINDGSSVFLGNNAGTNDDGGNNNTAVGTSSLTNNTSGQNNTAIGRQSLAINTSGNDNTMIGQQAGLSNSSGYQNTAVGSASLDANTGGYDNTAIGYSVMGSNTSGRLNVAVGSAAMSTNTIGIENTAIGVGALSSNLDGNYNIAVGSAALSGMSRASYNIGIGRNTLSNVSGSPSAQFNIGLGDQAVASLTSGSRNIGIGGSALNSLSSGIGNVGIGMEALMQSTTANYNTALGFNAGMDNTDGTLNTYIGYQSGENGTTGDNNTFVGANAGFSNTTGSDNVFIGSNAGLSETGSDKLYIDNNGTANPLIWGDFATRDIRINGGFQIGNPATTGYELPSADGTALQVLQTDGTGSISWANISAGDTDWVDVGADIERQTGNVYIGDNSATDNDIYISDRIIDWDNTAFYLDPGLISSVDEVIFSNGSNVDPSIRFADTNTGFFSPAANIISYSANGTETLRIQADGELSMGSTTPTTYDISIQNSFNTKSVFLGAAAAIQPVALIENSTDNTENALEVRAGSGNASFNHSAIYTFNNVGDFTTDIARNESGANLFGLKVDMPNDLIGTEYGIYSDVQTANGHAGYFLGDLTVGTTSVNTYTFPASRGINGQVMQTDGSGNLFWTTLTNGESTTASNGLTESGDDVQLGGSLNQNTTITYGANNLIHNLNTTGYFEIQDAGTAKFRLSNTGNTRLGGDLQINQTSVTGTRLIDLNSSGSTGLVDVYTAGIQTARIAGTGDSYINGGSFGLGITNPQEQLDVVDNVVSYVGDFYNENTASQADGISVRLAASNPNASAYYLGFFRATGATVSGRISGTPAGTGVQLVTSSDARLKTNFTDVDNALDMIARTNPQWYEFKSNLGQRELGFLAQELKKVYPQAVSGDETSDPLKDPMMVDYSRLTPLLAAGIQELSEKVSTLEAENAELKAALKKYEALEARITALEGADSYENSSIIVADKEE